MIGRNETMGLYCIHDSELPGVVAALAHYVDAGGMTDQQVVEVRDLLERLREAHDELSEKGRV